MTGFLYTGLLLAGLVATRASRFDPSTVRPLGLPPDKSVDNPLALITRHGYKGQQHEVVTEDGYILAVTRILQGQGPPVLMVNGMGLGPELWVLHGPGHDLAFVLADLGYDVWLGGQRGLVHSDKHLTLDISQKEYWDFSHDESGYYDLPAMIDLIKNETGYAKVFYVGTSLGGTFFMAMCNDRPEYCADVAGNVQFAPAMWIPRMDQAQLNTRIILDTLKGGVEFLKGVGLAHFLLRPPVYVGFIMDYCGTMLGEGTCFAILHMLTGFNKENMVKGWLAYTVSFCASGTSIRQIDHLIQQTKKGGARKYDFGTAKNMIKYNSAEPPEYNLRSITSPTVIYYSKIDKLLPYVAMKNTINRIGNLTFAKPAKSSNFGHAEFVFGKDMYKLFYSEIVDFFDSISGMG